MVKFQLVVYVPNSHVEVVKTALFNAGAGHYDTYDCCCWQVQGLGQFRPLSGSRPHIGEEAQISHIEEVRIEMLVTKDVLNEAINALKKSHPFEVPAYHIIQHYEPES